MDILISSGDGLDVQDICASATWAAERCYPLQGRIDLFASSRYIVSATLHMLSSVSARIVATKVNLLTLPDIGGIQSSLQYATRAAIAIVVCRMRGTATIVSMLPMGSHSGRIT
jgi:hypothetical protein